MRRLRTRQRKNAKVPRRETVQKKCVAQPNDKACRSTNRLKPSTHKPMQTKARVETIELRYRPTKPTAKAQGR
jgi:hypothetical protein